MATTVDRMPLRVVLADDNYLVREGIMALLAEVEGIELVESVGDPQALLTSVRQHQPDAVLTDIRMPPTHTTEGIDAAKQIRAEHPSIGVVVLSQYVEEEYALALLSDGVAGLGYLLKERVADVAEFISACRRVAAGGTALDPEVVAQLLTRSRRREPLAMLTPREREVLGLMAEGRSNTGIAQQLVVSDGAVEKHITSILTKLELPVSDTEHRRVLAVLTYLRAP